MMERGVHDAGLDSFRDSGAQDHTPGTACNLDRPAILDSPLLRVVGMDLENIFFMPEHIRSPACLSSHVVLRERTACCQDQRILAGRPFIGCDVFGEDKLSLASNESTDMHRRRALGSFVVAGPLDA